MGPLWLSQELADKQSCTQCLTKKRKKERKRNAKREQMSNKFEALKERNTKVWGWRRTKRGGVGRVRRSSRLDPERGHADPITPADILNVCTCGPWCCLQPLSCLAGPHQPRGSGSLLLLLALHHYRPHAFPETSWAQPLGGPRWLSHVPAAAAGGGGDILKRVTQAVTGRGHFLCFLSLKRLMRSEAGADSAFVFPAKDKKKLFMFCRCFI